MKNNFKPNPKMADIVKPRPDVRAEPKPEPEPEPKLTDIELTPDFEEEQVQQEEETENIAYPDTEPKDLFLDLEQIKEKKREAVSILSKRTIIVFNILGILSLFTVLYFVLPKVQITLFLKEAQVPLTVKVSADKNANNINISLNKIPAKEILIQDKVEGEFKTSTEKEVLQKAQGKITIYNQYSSSPQALVATTRFLSRDNKIFRLKKDIVVPGAKIEEGKIIASSIETEVVADEAGDNYNIGPTKFSIPGFEGTAKEQGFWAESNQAMSGGMKGKFKIVTEEDINEAKKALLPSLEEKIAKNLSQESQADWERGAGEEKIIEVKSSPEKGEKADKFTLTLNVKIKILFFNKKDINNFIAEKILQDETKLASLRERKETKFEIKKQQIDYLKKESDFKKEQILIEAESMSVFVPLFSIPELKAEIKGGNKESIVRAFDKMEAIEKVKVIFWPFWVKKVPQDAQRIEIIID